MMRRMQIFVILTVLLVSIYAPPALAIEKPKPVNIGVYVRSGFEECIERWSQTAKHLTRTVPGYDFSIIPLASREDIYNALENGKIDFLAANSAIYACAEERFGTSAMCGMVSVYDPSGHNCTGSLIRKADRNDLARIKDLKEKHLTAVKPWAFDGWIMQWQALRQHDVDPSRDLAPISFEGTHQDVIQAVLDDTADVGAVATDFLKQRIESGKVDPESLFVFNRKGEAVGIEKGVVPSTEAYPDWVFAKTAKTPDVLAENVAASLVTQSHDPQTKHAKYHFSWTVPQSYQTVRNTLRELMGPDYVTTTELFPKQRIELPGLALTSIIALILVTATVMFIVWQRLRRKDKKVYEELRVTQHELNESRASKNLIDAILTQVNCGIDIIDGEDRILYVTQGIESQYGSWQGKKCHEYYRGSSTPCDDCAKRIACKNRDTTASYVGTCHVAVQEDTHPLGEPSEKGGPSKLLQVQFYNASGQWLYARVHFPPEE